MKLTIDLRRGKEWWSYASTPRYSFTFVTLEPNKLCDDVTVCFIMAKTDLSNTGVI
jgi:hypothetical protein